ncbi:MAG: ankyrin repeat domain-containing protein [Geobacter sp.]|nr:ankyrin repeat domain-containing protein [Geobacter sp.]
MKIFALSLIFACAIAGPAQALSVILPPDIDNTDLHKAAEACDVEKERAVLDAIPATEKAREINRIDREGYTPLAYAAQKGCMDVVTLLVEANADVDATYARIGWTPLLHAAQSRHADVVGYLLAHGAEVNRKTASGLTPLSVALSGSPFNHGHEGDRNKTLLVLLENGADINLAATNPDHEQQQLKIRSLEKERERMADEIRRLHDEIRRINETLNDIRSRIGDGQVRPY